MRCGVGGTGLLHDVGGHEGVSKSVKVQLENINLLYVHDRNTAMCLRLCLSLPCLTGVSAALPLPHCSRAPGRDAFRINPGVQHQGPRLGDHKMTCQWVSGN